MYIVFYTSNSKNCTSMCDTEQAVLQHICPGNAVYAVRSIEQEGIVRDHDINFKDGQLVLNLRPCSSQEAVEAHLDALESALNDFHYNKDASAEELLAWIESTTHFELRRD